jgi:hypothetical protein
MEVCGQLSMAIVLVVFDRGLPDRLVHPLDLTVGPGRLILVSQCSIPSSSQTRSKVQWKAYLWCAMLVNWIPIARIDEAVRNIVALKFRLGLFENAVVVADNADAILRNPQCNR